ncbi:MAG TPA: hypothetical protein VKA15_27900 [Isosphaeraceae bacterium]|nr:hypothetical protein [Isosphaeraceae bacterium]
MNPVEKTSEEAGDSGSKIGAIPEVSSILDIEVNPKIREAVAKHRIEWEELMKKHPYQWAAYHGDKRLEIGKSKEALYHKYLDRGIRLEELVVLGIGPPIPDVIDDDEVSEW